MRLNVRTSLASALVAAAALAGAAGPAAATPALVADLVTGEVIAQEEATRLWYPASLTKLMTAYVALKAVREGRVTMDTPFVVSPRAAKAPPSKMGFNPGTEVTLDNALKMLMVKSANDLAVMIAEGLAGSVEDFAVEMNAAARDLGMKQSHFVNPNGLHDPNHYSSARDLALLARALYMEFPEYSDLYGIGALKLGDRVIPTHNGLIGRYPGADGMKTGFVCPSGFNVVASALRGGRHIVVVVMGSPNAKLRTIKAAKLFDAGFAAGGGLRSAMLTNLPDMAGPPPNMRAEICGKNKKTLQEDDLAILTPPNQTPDDSPAAFFANDGRPAGQPFVMGPRPVFEPIDVFVGRKPGYVGPVAQARPAPAVAAAPPPVPGASAFAAQPGIGATASRAIAVKSVSEKKNVRTAEKPKVEAKAKPVSAKAKPAGEAKAKQAAKAQAKKPAVKEARKEAPKAAQKPVPVKAASKAKDKAQ